MGFFDVFKRKTIKNQVRNYTDPFIVGEDYPTAQNDPLKLSAVYGAIQTISNTMSKIPFFVMDRNTKKHIDDDNLYTILNVQPNAKMNASVMHKMMWSKDLIKGNAYAVIIRERRSTKIKEIIPVAEDVVSIGLDDNGNLVYEVTLNDSRKLRLRYDEIIHLKEFTLDGVHGIPILDYAIYTTGAGLNQEQWQKHFYENYCRPLDYLQTQTDLSSRSVKRIVKDDDGKDKEITVSLKDVMREEWKKAHSGENKFSTAILDNGLTYGTVPQLTMEQLDFVNSKDINVQDIARFFGMGSCMFKLGVGSQTYSSNEQGQICYINETIASRLRQWEQELTLKLLTEEQRQKGWVIKGNLNAELRGDSAARANWYDKMRSMGVYNINEMRELEDLPSIGEEGDTRLIGANSIPLERLLEGGTAGSVTPNDLNENNEEQTPNNEENSE